MRSYRGGCHCGAVRFEITLDAPVNELVDCNCSICTKKGILHLGARDDQFTLLCGEELLRLYQFGSGAASHWFCKDCGIHVYGRPRSAPERYTVNARCLDDFYDIRARAGVRQFDGINHPKDRHG